MRRLIESSKLFSLISVITLLITYVFALGWGVVKAVAAWAEIWTSHGKSAGISLSLIKLVDAFLIAIVLYFLAVSIYKLFIGDIPGKMAARSLPELKSKLSSVIVLVIAVHFTEALFDPTRATLDILWLALATAVVTAVLIAFGYFSHFDKKEEE
jgi:uncharacterized membrane protein YqhA